MMRDHDILDYLITFSTHKNLRLMSWDTWNDNNVFSLGERKGIYKIHKYSDLHV